MSKKSVSKISRKSRVTKNSNSRNTKNRKNSRNTKNSRNRKTKSKKYRMNVSSSSSSSSHEEKKEEQEKEIFNGCTDKEFNLGNLGNDNDTFLKEKQQIYEEYMKTASCFFKHVLPEKFKCTNENNENYVTNFINLLLYMGRKLFNFHAKHLELSNNRPYRGKISYPKNQVINEINRQMFEDEYYVIRDNIERQNYNFGTYASHEIYPKISSLLYPYFKNNDLQIYHKLLGPHHRHLPNTYTLCIDYYSEDRKKIMFNDIKIGKYQTLGLEDGDLIKIKHPHDIVNALYKDVGKENLIYQLGLKWCELLNLYENYKDDKKEEEYTYISICLEIYYLFVNSVPYWRGTAGAAKVFLNTCLGMFDLPLLKESEEYSRQADWVAFTSSDFQEFLSVAPTLFMYLE